ncbi:MAG: GNAT family N-acetyltransferase [Actinomycetota bacterium]|nr:GNAT family N-acetyltransferase [Actinomycetota bacterium]
MTSVGVPGGLEIFTLAERPDLTPRVRSLPGTFPEFMHHDAAVNRHWSSLFTDFAAFQVAVCEGEGEKIVAAGHCIPAFWDQTVEGLPEGLDEVLERGVEGLALGRAPTVVSALLAIVPEAYRGRGLSSVVLTAMKGVAAEHGLVALIAPVRPTLKDRYPLTPMERYVRWEQAEGLPFDPWLRVHSRLGAKFLRVAPRSMVITGTIREWEGWAGMRFPESGAYVVPGALQPVLMDLERDLGTYEEPNVWMRHPVETEG